MILDINKKTARYICLAVFLLLIDRFFKSFIWLNQDFEYKIIGEYFKINFAMNPYIAFSIPFSGFILVLLIFLVLIFILAFFFKLHRVKAYHAAGLLLLVFVGASSNLFDRLKYGVVIDYFDLKYFTIFNLADSMIVLSAFALFFVLHSTHSNP